MKTNDDLWTRLSRAARSASDSVPEAMPFGFDTRVLAAWRAGEELSLEFLWVPLLRKALVGASLILACSLLLAYPNLHSAEQNELAVADAVIKLSVIHEWADQE